MARMVQHAITVKKTIYGTAYVDCSEDEHHPEKLIHEVEWQDWDRNDADWDEVVDSDIIDGWDEEEVE